MKISSVACRWILAPVCSICEPLESMTMHRLYIIFFLFGRFSVSAPYIFYCPTSHVLFTWPISCIGPHVLLSIIPHAWEIFLEMLTVDRHREFHAVQLLKPV